jgi:hypothetical protein
MPDIKAVAITAGVMLVSAFVVLMSIDLVYACGLNGRCPWGG